MSLVSDPPAGEQSGANPSDPAPEASSKSSWEPTAKTFHKFLALLSSDFEDAGKEYEKLRTKLIRFFEWRGCDSADILADRTFDRVLKKIDEGETITNPKAYVRKVAYYIYLEHDRALLVELNDECPLPAPDGDSGGESDDNEALSNCCDECLAELPPESKRLILAYYQNEKRKKKDGRRELAEELGIPMNALRIRTHRIRKILERCIQKCMAP